MQTSTSLHHDEGLPGQLAQDEAETEALKTRFIGQVTRLTIDDPFIAAVYSLAIQVTPGYIPVFEYDATADSDENEADAGFVAQWNTSPQFRQLGLASDSGDGTIDIAWTDYNRTWTVTPTATNDAIFTAAVQTAASTTTARFGVLVTRGTKSADPRDCPPIAALTGSTTASQIRGMVIREDAGTEQPTAANQTADSFDFYPAPRAVPVLNRGRGWVVCETAMTFEGAIFVRRAGSGIIGAVRNDNAGGDAIDISSIAKVEVGGAAGRTCKVKLHVPL